MTKTGAPAFYPNKRRLCELATMSNDAAAWRAEAQTSKRTVADTELHAGTVAVLLGTSTAVAITSFFTEHLVNTIPGSPPVKLKHDVALRSTLDQLQQAMDPHQDATGEEQVSQSMGSKHVVLLRRALLLVKTAQLYVEDDSKPVFVQALWNAIKQTAKSITDYHSKADTMPAPTEQHTPAEGAEAERLALLLVEFTLPMLRRSLTACSQVPDSPHSQMNHNAAAHRHGALPCTTGILCDLLVCVLITSCRWEGTRRISQLCAVKVLESGAFQVLWCLLYRELLPEEQVAKHEAELAHLNGLCRCSALMCPSLAAACHEQATEAFEQKWIPNDTFGGEAKSLWQVASVMGHLHLQVIPRSQDEIDNQTCSQLWKTPAYYKWEDIQTVACRLLVTLEWARRGEAAAAEAALCKDEYTGLRETLVMLLTLLLVGHLQDDKLNMQKVFR
ncbi:hypothetical protein ABBQ38_009331 [Trebouxia sp. C0009 RCD-2024]